MDFPMKYTGLCDVFSLNPQKKRAVLFKSMGGSQLTEDMIFYAPFRRERIRNLPGIKNG